MDPAFQNMANALADHGCVLLHTKDGTEKKQFSERNRVKYARNVLQYTKDGLMKYAGKYFKLTKEDPADEDGRKTYFLSEILL